jgi:hypothetical protein
VEPVEAWRVLGLRPGSSADDVRRAFRVAAQILHPDRVADCSPDVQAEAQRRMVELGEAYRVCAAVSRGAPPPPPRAHGQQQNEPPGPLHSVGGRAAALLDEARRTLLSVASSDVYRASRPTVLSWDDNSAASREVVTMLEQVADAWPGTAEGDAARVLLVVSAAARNSLSPRERAGHLVLVVDVAARDDAWEALTGRDELAIAQVVYRHPTANPDLRARARKRLAELDDWATLASDDDEGVRATARGQLLLQQGRLLAERATWLSRRERPAFDDDLHAWRAEVSALAVGVDERLTDQLARTDRAIVDALAPKAARG